MKPESERDKEMELAALKELTEQLSAENARLHAELDARKAEQLSAEKRRSRFAKWLIEVVWNTWAGPDIATSAKRIKQRLNDTGKFDGDEVIDLLAALFNRVFRYGKIAIIIALVPLTLSVCQTHLLGVQNGLIAEQNQFLQNQIKIQQEQIYSQRSESNALRAASLVATLYDRSKCQLEDQSQCPIAADIRTRAEAAVAYASIMRPNVGNLPIGNWPFAGQNFPTSHPYGPKVNLTGVNLEGVTLWNADLSETDFSRGSLAGSKLNGANLSTSSFYAANLNQADLRLGYLDGASLLFCKCQGASFVHASLKKALLTRADFTGAFFGSTDLSGADIRGTNFTKAFWGSPEQPLRLTGAIYDDSTIWPDGFSADIARALGAIHVKDLPADAARNLMKISSDAVFAPEGLRSPYSKQ
jgi:uncharacterized protein YjbI with pentapeptide repeats